MKRFNYVLLFLLIFSGTSKLVADEGMWLPMFIERLNYTDMQKLGLQLTAEEIYSVNHASMKDAIVGLSSSPTPNGFFCTGEIVSEEGLMLTNHHCGYDAIQKLSSIGHDYLGDGFWAMNREEELPSEGMTASILVYMADVTDSILPFISDTLSGRERNMAIRKITSKLKKQAKEDGKYHPVIKSFFNGNEYYMFVYQVYRDVRLVGAPPSSIGKYGGDTDNWMWPRHTGDFSMFRIYTAPDGSPADYAEENIPLVPKYHLPISLDGINEGDFTMVFGFPGGTERYTTSAGLQYKLDYYLPPLIEAFGAKLEVWKEHMDADREVGIKYASNYASLANSWKYFIGQQQGVKKLDVVGSKASFEEKFMQWVNADDSRKEKYGHVLSDISEVYDSRAPSTEPIIYASVTGVGGAGIIGFAQEFMGLHGILKQYKEEKDKENKAKKQEQIMHAAENLKNSASEHFKNYDFSTDRDVFARMTALYFEKLPDKYHPEVLDKMEAKFKGDFNRYADYLFEKSFMSDLANTKTFLDDPKLKTLEKDPAFVLMQGYMEKIMEIRDGYMQGGDKLSRAERLFVQGIREMLPEEKFYPDANSTLRFSFGTVKDYYPADAIQYDYKAHLSGVLEKEDPTNPEFYVEPELKALYETKDYGPYADAGGNMVVCFLTNNDITGGNSGSPVVNASGELIGLAFDGNWEAMSSDIAFSPEMQRTIVVDIRYVLFIIDKLAGAGHLVDEMTIHKSMPEPVRVEQTVVKEIVID
jgi:hypothetical protein